MEYGIDNDKTHEDLMKMLSSSKLEKLITEYNFDTDRLSGRF